MALKIRKGTDAERLTITPASGELIYTTDTKQIFVGDSTTVGGIFVGPASSEALTLGGDLTLNGHDIVGTGNINIAGTITATGNINLGNDDADNIVLGGEVNSNIIPNTIAPATVSTFNLGASTSQWNNAWIDNLIVSNIVASTMSGLLDGDLKGSVFADNSTMLVDGVSGKIVGPVEANVTGNVTGDVIATDSTTIVNATTKTFTGNLVGNVNGDVSGAVTGTFRGQLINDIGQVFLDTNASDVSTLPLNVIGSLRGDVLATDSTTLINGDQGSFNLNGTIQDDIVPAIGNTVNLGSSDDKFNNAYLNGEVFIGTTSTQSISASGSSITLKGAIQTNSPVTGSLNADIIGTVSSFTLTDAIGIRAGATFKLPGTGLLTVDNVNIGTNTVTTTTPFAAPAATSGTMVVFYNPSTAVSSFRFEAPPTKSGQPGDRKGMIFADATHIYVCIADYTDGVSDIWTRSTATTTW